MPGEVGKQVCERAAGAAPGNVRPLLFACLDDLFL
jgi:hypothetical protein